MKPFKYLILLLLFLFPFGQLTRLPLGIVGVNIYFQDIVIGFLVGSWFVWHILRRKPFLKPTLLFPVMFFFLIAFLSLLINFFSFAPGEILVAGFYLLRLIFYAGVYFALQECLAYGEGECYFDTLHLRWGLILAGTATAVFGLIQYFFYPDLGNLAYLGWDPHKYRVFGTFLDPAFLGLILVLTLILLMGSHAEVAHEIVVRLQILSRSISGLLNNILGARKVKHSQNLWAPRVAEVIYYLWFSVSYLALALTYSRSSYLAFLAGMGIIARIKKASKIFFFSLLLVLTTVVILPRPLGSEGVKLEREEGIWGRVKNWQESLTIFKGKPVLGVGFNTYRYVQRNYGFINKETWQETHGGAGADSSFLFILATTGVLGFFAFTYIIYMIYKTYKKNPVIMASLGAVFIHSWFANSLFYPWIMLWMWILIGITEDKQTIPRLRSG